MNMCIDIAPQTTVLNKLSNKRISGKNAQDYFTLKCFLLNSLGEMSF